MILSVSDLSAVRSGRAILHPTSLEIMLDDRIGLVGPSGSGKSTFGHALIDNLRAQNIRVAHVPQTPDQALDPLRSMDFHWRETESALGLPHDADRQASLFQALNIEGGDLRKRPWGWSRGMQQRFVIALALIDSPDLLIMDEPTSALDPIVAARTMTLLESYLSTRNTAMLLITHDLGLAAQRVNRLLVMDEGRIVEDGPTQKVLNNPQSQVAQSLCAHRNWLTLPC